MKKPTTANPLDEVRKTPKKTDKPVEEKRVHVNWLIKPSYKKRVIKMSADMECPYYEVVEKGLDALEESFNG